MDVNIKFRTYQHYSVSKDDMERWARTVLMDSLSEFSHGRKNGYAERRYPGNEEKAKEIKTRCDVADALHSSINDIQVLNTGDLDISYDGFNRGQEWEIGGKITEEMGAELLGLPGKRLTNGGFRVYGMAGSRACAVWTHDHDTFIIVTDDDYWVRLAWERD